MENELDKETLERSATVRREVESYLGEQSAHREYVLEAKKQLYHSIGPLRFQLLLACRDAAHRRAMV